MGAWKITIEGEGPHHNADYPGDAEKLGALHVRDFRDRGHMVTSARFEAPLRHENLLENAKQLELTPTPVRAAPQTEGS